MPKNILISILIASASLLHAQTYDPAVQFSLASNPNGAWRYGYESTTLGSDFTLFDTAAPIVGDTIDAWQSSSPGTIPHITHNRAGSTFNWTVHDIEWAVDELSLHPGPGGQFAVLRFVVPADGAYDVVANFRGIDRQGASTDIHVIVNNVSVFDGTANGFHIPASFVGMLSLNQNDTLDFAVGYGADRSHLNDSTGLVATIIAVPEPTINVSPLPNVSIDPRRTYLRFNAAKDFDPEPPHTPPLGPAILDLAAKGIAPGEFLFLERSGRFRWSDAFQTEEGRNVWAVFSSSVTVDQNPPLSHPNPKRIPGAILPENVSVIVTEPTLPTSQGEEYPADIPEDFMADRVLVKVPVGATHLMFGAGDIKWADNLDGPPADFQIAVTQIRDPNFDTDGDGASDLDEFLSGTDYNNPSSRPSLAFSSSPLPGNARVNWMAQPFRIYQIEESTDISLWNPIESLPTVTVPTPMQRDYPLSSRHFYQLRVIGMLWD